MPRKLYIICSAFIALLFLTTACFPEVPPAAPAPTYDPCAPDNIGLEINRVKDLMHEFDDTTFIAKMTPPAQLAEVILELQDVRRRTEAVSVPSCVSDFQKDAIDYMNAEIKYLAYGMGDFNPIEVATAADSAEKLRGNYEAEYTRLTGVVYAPATEAVPVHNPETTEAPPTEAATIQATPTLPIPTATLSVEVIVENPGTQPINLRAYPSMTAQPVGSLNPLESARAIARTSAGDWLLLDFAKAEGGHGWVFFRLVKLNRPAEQLPIQDFTPTPSSS
jgi:hypothetical protein